MLGLITLSFWFAIVRLGGQPGPLVPMLWSLPVGHGGLAEYLYLAAAILGAIISPYLVFFYSSGAHGKRSGRSDWVVEHVLRFIPGNGSR